MKFYLKKNNLAFILSFDNFVTKNPICIYHYIRTDPSLASQGKWQSEESERSE